MADIDTITTSGNLSGGSLTEKYLNELLDPSITPDRYMVSPPQYKKLMEYGKPLDLEEAKTWGGAELYKHKEEIESVAASVAATRDSMKPTNPYYSQVEQSHILLVEYKEKIDKYERKLNRQKKQFKEVEKKHGKEAVDLLLQIEQAEAKVKRIVKT